MNHKTIANYTGVGWNSVSTDPPKGVSFDPIRPHHLARDAKSEPNEIEGRQHADTGAKIHGIPQPEGWFPTSRIVEDNTNYSKKLFRANTP